MKRTQHGYLLGIGSNIEPHYHLCQIIHSLVDYFGEISLSRVIMLPPIGMNSSQPFLNTVVFINTDLPETTLKQLCNRIEIRQGRDRNDPQKKVKDRPADLDILKAMQIPDDAVLPIYSITDEYFLHPLIEELFAYLTDKPFQSNLEGVPLTIGQLMFGQTATTIYRDTDSRKKRIF